MRTTVTLESDAEQIIRERMRRERVSFKQALNDAVRAGGARTGPVADYVTPSVPLGRPRLNLDRAGQLAAELEDDALLAKLRDGR